MSFRNFKVKFFKEQNNLSNILTGTTLSSNVAIGVQSGYNQTGSSNVNLGKLAGKNTNQNNVLIGEDALLYTGTTPPSNNVVIGYRAARATNNIGNGNTIIGYAILNGSTESLSNTIVIGSGAGEALRFNSSRQMQLINYTSANFNGTPTSFLGVDASGNVVKQVRTWQSGIATTTTDANGEFILGSIPSSANAVTCCQYDSAGTATVYIFVYRGKNGSNQHFFKVYDLSGNAVTSASIGVSFTYTMYPV